MYEHYSQQTTCRLLFFYLALLSLLLLFLTVFVTCI